jgi:ubiquinone/menaquinone biosynthesis C-methylase UbiE
MDPETKRILAERGLRPSWRCLELGAGTGSIARWLAEQCPDGQVIATDLDIPHLAGAEAPNLEVRRHDVVREEFPKASFDLVHARSLLVNLPERDDVLAKIAGWLTPGGWAMIEEPTMPLHRSSPTPRSGGCSAPTRKHSPSRTAPTSTGRDAYPPC